MTTKVITGLVLDEESTLTLAELSRACMMHAEWISDLVDEGILEPYEHEAAHWYFSGSSLKRAHTVKRLQMDLGVNLAGAALILDLIEENELLRARLNILE